MAIIKRAKNLIVNIKNEYRHFSGSYECVSDEVQIIATEGNLTLTSAKKIAVKKGSDNTTAKSVVEQNKNGVKGGNSDNYKKINGHFYKTDGTFLGKEYSKDFTGDVNDVYICDPDFIRPQLSDNNWVYKAIQNLGPIKAKDRVYENVKKLTIKGVDIKNDTLLRIAGLAFSETGLADEAIRILPYTILNHYKQLFDTKRTIKIKKEITKDLTWRNGILDKVIIKMRNEYSDIEYAIGEDGKGGNKVFRITFLGYTDRNITKIDFEKNAFKRNENDKIRLAVKSTIDALNYFDKGSNEKEDISKRAIGWHGRDIKKNEYWKEKLYIIKNNKLYGFENWENKHPEEDCYFVSVSIHYEKSAYGPTIFYKTTKKGNDLL